MKPLTNYIGKKFGTLTVTERLPAIETPSGLKLTRLACKCECGEEEVFWYGDLQTGRRTKCRSCKRKGQHSKHPLYSTWTGMKRRCDNIADKNYGGRGISVCKGWLESFVSFAEDVGPKPSPNHTIDRNNNDAGYTCGHCDECKEKGWLPNCRWATPKEQVVNSRVVRLLEIDGVSMCLADWAKKIGISREAMRVRVNKCINSGASLREALKPVSLS